MDVARFGDDLTVLALLDGNQARIVAMLSKANGVQLAKKAAELVEQYKGLSVAVDGGVLGGRAVDSILELMRRGKCPKSLELYDWDIGSADRDKTDWANKRAELWYRLRDWRIQDEGALVPDPQLEEALLAVTYKFGRGAAAILESKDHIKPG